MKAILVIVDITIDTLKDLMKLGTDVMTPKLGELEVKPDQLRESLYPILQAQKDSFQKRS
eukprot:CAMPEP_0196999472 /NCGR_PEP_ID=MMETSP1380-20130617/4638_1 /TAXON_ID=5936 /ORGANISM="Euplotes crassus, Strain CT5" /LENGTH=59 /DNA_ID=CAMNT_0042416409 /DNA_START=688 /DNA_END=868 /DNA_ORIENTATION=-